MLVALLLPAVSGCAGAHRPATGAAQTPPAAAPAPGEVPPPAASAPASPPAGAPAEVAGAFAAAWTVQPADLATQRLFRVTYDGADGGGSFRLTLLLATPRRYQVRAVDPFGRALWTLDVDGDSGLWLDHRNRLTCTLAGRLDLAAARLAPFPLPALPALLLGRLPAPPAGEVDVEAAPGQGAEAGGTRIAFRDDEGRRWSALLAAGLPTAWTLYDGGEAQVWWLLRDGEAFLSDAARGTQLRWRQTVREELPGDLAVPAVPEGYRAVDCTAAYGS